MREKTCMVPLSEEQAKYVELGLKQILCIMARSAPLLNSCNIFPEAVENTLINVPRSEADATNVPSKFNAKAINSLSCPGIMTCLCISNSSMLIKPLSLPGKAITRWFV